MEVADLLRDGGDGVVREVEDLEMFELRGLVLLLVIPHRPCRHLPNGGVKTRRFNLKRSWQKFNAVVESGVIRKFNQGTHYWSAGDSENPLSIS